MKLLGATLAAFTFTALGCGTEAAVMEPELVPGDSTPLLTGTVIAADSFVVPATSQNFTVAPFASAGLLPTALPPSSGRFLALSVFDLSRPDVVCVGGPFDTNCATMVVFENQTSPNLSIGLASGRTNYFLHDSFVMEQEPPPG